MQDETPEKPSFLESQLHPKASRNLAQAENIA
jgi:hypothetical protein